jgi:hypothetical protein
MNDNRLIVRMLDYWKRIKKDEILPDFRKNNPTMIEDLWQQCFVLSLVPGHLTTFKYEYMGDKIKSAYIDNIINMTFDLKSKQFPSSIIAPKLQNVLKVMEMKSPHEDQGQMPGPNGKFLKYRTILLPFGDKNGLTHIVVGVSFREF